MGHHQLLHMRRSLSGLSFGQHAAAGAGCSSKKEVQQQQLKPPPKGCMAVRVGQEQERFVVPVAYLNHPLFVGLLKEAEEEYGFEHRGGAITIPCHVDHFRHVQGIIHRDMTGRYVGGVGSEHNHGQHHHHHHHHLHFHLYACFKAS